MDPVRHLIPPLQFTEGAAATQRGLMTIKGWWQNQDWNTVSHFIPQHISPDEKGSQVGSCHFSGHVVSGYPSQFIKIMEGKKAMPPTIKAKQ